MPTDDVMSVLITVPRIGPATSSTVAKPHFAARSISRGQQHVRQAVCNLVERQCQQSGACLGQKELYIVLHCIFQSLEIALIAQHTKVDERLVSLIGG